MLLFALIAMSNDRLEYSTTEHLLVESAVHLHCVLYKIQRYVWIRGPDTFMTSIVTMVTFCQGRRNASDREKRTLRSK